MFGLFKKKLDQQDQSIVDDGCFFLLNQLPGIDGKFAYKVASSAFYLAKEIALRDFGGDAYTKNLGTRMLDTELGKKRLSDGVTRHEVIEYWNKMPIEIVFDDQLENGRMVGYVQTYKRDQDPDELVKVYRQTYVRFGMPELYDPMAPGNEGYTMEDAPIYSELKPRIDRYMQVNGSSTQLFGLNSSSINAIIRQGMRDGHI